MKYTLHLKQDLPFASAPAIAELDAERILCNDVILPGETHPHGMRLWVIGNEYGALGAVWANHEQDALDELVDAGLGDGLLVREEDRDDDCAHLGNAGEPADLTYAWLAKVTFDLSRDIKLLLALAEARGAGVKTLDQVN